MKKIIIFSLILNYFPILFANAQDMAVATVRLEKTKPIFGKQLDKAIALVEMQQGKKLSISEKKKVLEQLVSQVLVVQAADADRSVTVNNDDIRTAAMGFVSQQLQAVGAIPAGAILTDTSQYKQMIEQQGMTVEEYEKNVRNQLLIEKYITSKNQAAFQAIKQPTVREIEAEYQRRISEFVVSDTVWFNQVFFDTSNAGKEKKAEKFKQAREAHRRLVNSSVTFTELIDSESENETSRRQGGIVGPIRKGDKLTEQLYGSRFLDKVFDLRVGEVSSVLESNAGYHIVKITEKKTAQLLSKDDPQVRQYLERLLYAKKYQLTFDRVSEEVIAELKKKATIKYFGDYK